MRILRSLCVALFAVAALAGAAMAAEPLRIGAMPLNTWWYVAGGALANLVQSKLPAGIRSR